MAAQTFCDVKRRAAKTPDSLAHDGEQAGEERAQHSAFRRLIERHMQGRAEGVALLSLEGACTYADGCLVALDGEPAERRLGLVSSASANAGTEACGLDLLGKHFVCIERWTDGFHAVSSARKGADASSDMSRQTLLGMDVGHSALVVAHGAPLGGSDGQEVRAMALHLADVLRGEPSVRRL